MAHDHSHTSSLVGSIKTAFFLNLGFTILEIFGGLWTNSVAILADAIHDLGDSLSLGTAWYLEKQSGRKSDRAYSFGYRRFSVLGALINATVLMAGSLFVLSETIPRLMRPEHSNAQGMLVFAIFGIAINGVAVFRLKGRSSLNVSVVAWHLLEDVFGWTAVLIVAIVLLFTDLHILDPILSIIVTLYVLYNVLRNLRKSLRVFLQAVPEGLDIYHIEKHIKSIKGVNDVHRTHVWSLDGERHIFTTHVVLNASFDLKNVPYIKKKIRETIKELGIQHTTVEIEYAEEGCDNNTCI